MAVTTCCRGSLCMTKVGCSYSTRRPSSDGTRPSLILGIFTSPRRAKTRRYVLLVRVLFVCVGEWFHSCASVLAERSSFLNYSTSYVAYELIPCLC